MIRLDIEKEIMMSMAQLDTTGAIKSTADQRLRLYVQGQIQGGVDDIVQEHPFKFRQKGYAAYMQGPLTGTLSWTQGQLTATVAGATPDDTWRGCHVMLTGNGFPLQIQSFAGQVLTFENAVMAASNAGIAFTVYFTSVLVPLECKTIRADTVQLDGHGFLSFLNAAEMPFLQGYFAVGSRDYGFQAFGNYTRTIQTPTIGEPNAYTSWDYTTISSLQRKLLTVYPYPSGPYSVSWKGIRKITQLTISGTGTGDNDVPDMPEDFHRSLLVPRVKLKMCGYPGFELSNAEKQMVQGDFTSSMRKFLSENLDDQTEIRPFRPSSSYR